MDRPWSSWKILCVRKPEASGSVAQEGGPGDPGTGDAGEAA